MVCRLRSPRQDQPRCLRRALRDGQGEAGETERPGACPVRTGSNPFGEALEASAWQDWKEQRGRLEGQLKGMDAIHSRLGRTGAAWPAAGVPAGDRHTPSWSCHHCQRQPGHCRSHRGVRPRHDIEAGGGGRRYQTHGKSLEDVQDDGAWTERLYDHVDRL